MTHTLRTKSKSRSSHISLTIAMATIGAVALPGCDGIWAKDAYTALQIMQAQVISPDDDCVVPAEPTSLYKDKGRLDIGIPDGLMRPYVLPLSLYNAMAAVGKTPAEEMNIITLQSFSIELSGEWYSSNGTESSIPWSDACPQKFEYSVGTVRIPPAGYVGARIEAMSSAHAYCLYQLPQFYMANVTAKIIARGRHGGTSIQSAPFKFVIQVCKGCLLTPIAGGSDVDRSGSILMCSALTADSKFEGCYIGQDREILCCTLKAENMLTSDILCPGKAQAAPASTN